MATHSRRRCRAPPHRGHRRLGAVACGVDDAMPLFIFSLPLQRMCSASEAWRSRQHLHLPTDGAKCRGLLGVPTAGWRNAPAYSPRGSTRGSAKLFGRSSLGARTQEHTDLEWFGPPERNTLRPLDGVLFLVTSLSSSQPCFLGPESFSNGRLLL